MRGESSSSCDGSIIVLGILVVCQTLKSARVSFLVLILIFLCPSLSNIDSSNVTFLLF